MNRVFFLIGHIVARNIQGFRYVARKEKKHIWKPIGLLAFRLAYRNACRMGNVYLHIGAGPVSLGGWLNTDISTVSPLFLDATRRFPIKDNSVSCIFSEHFIEHISRPAAISFIKESFRVLQPGGILATQLGEKNVRVAYTWHRESKKVLKWAKEY